METGRNENAIVDVARSFVGLPYVEGSADPEVGLDCVGLLIAVMKKAGRLDLGYRPPPYRYHEPVEKAIAEIAPRLEEIAIEDVRPEDVLVVAIGGGRGIAHVGIVGDHPDGGLSIIEASRRVGRVVEVGLSGPLRRRARAFRAPALASEAS